MVLPHPLNIRSSRLLYQGANGLSVFPSRYRVKRNTFLHLCLPNRALPILV